jgi:hypothetical protein
VRSKIQKPSLFLSKLERSKILKKKPITLLVSCGCETWSLILKIFENEVGLVVHETGNMMWRGVGVAAKKTV